MNHALNKKISKRVISKTGNYIVKSITWQFIVKFIVNL